MPWAISNEPGPLVWLFQKDSIAKEHCELRAWPILENCPLNNIASLVNAITRVVQLNFFGFNRLNSNYPSRFAYHSLFTSNDFQEIYYAPIYSSMGSPSDDWLAFWRDYGVNTRTVNELPAFYTQLLNRSAIRTRFSDTVILESWPILHGFKWVSVDDVRQAAEARGFKFTHFKLFRPVNPSISGSGQGALVTFAEANGDSDWYGVRVPAYDESRRLGSIKVRSEGGDASMIVYPLRPAESSGTVINELGTVKTGLANSEAYFFFDHTVSAE